MRASDLMTERVRTLPDTSTLADAITLVVEYEIRHVPIVDEAGHLVGVLSDRELRQAEGLMARRLGDSAETSRVLQSSVVSILAPEPLSCAPETHVDEVIDMLVERRSDAVVVIDGEGTVCGIISSVDVLQAARGRL